MFDVVTVQWQLPSHPPASPALHHDPRQVLLWSRKVGRPAKLDLTQMVQQKLLPAAFIAVKPVYTKTAFC